MIDYKSKPAFAALLAYRMNCILHYDSWRGGAGESRGGVKRRMSTAPIPPGQQKEDFAKYFNVGVYEMDDPMVVCEVDLEISRNKAIDHAKTNNPKKKYTPRKGSAQYQRDEILLEIKKIYDIVSLSDMKVSGIKGALKDLTIDKYRQFNILIDIDQIVSITKKDKKDIENVIEGGFLKPVDSSKNMFKLFDVLDFDNRTIYINEQAAAAYGNPFLTF